MNNQTESYIILKPIAERFNRIANSITDNEIKELIKSEMRNQLKTIDFTVTIEEIIEDYLDNHSDEVLNLYKNGLKEKLK